MSKFRAVLRRHWPLLLVTTLLGAVAGVVSSQFATSDVETVYTAEQVVIANPNSGSKPLIPQDALKVTRGAVPVLAAEIFTDSEGVEVEAEKLAAKIDTEYESDSSSLTISSDDIDANLAQARVAAFTGAFLEITNADLQADSRRQVDQLESDLEDAREALEAFDQTYPELTQPGSVIPNDAATQQLVTQRRDIQARIAAIEAEVRESELALSRILPYETLGPERPRQAASGLVDVPASAPVRAGLLGLFGLLLGGVVTMIIERINRRVDTRDELVEVTDIPILAEIGYLPKSKRHSDGAGALVLDGVWAEPYRRVRSAIQFVQATRPTNTPPGTVGAPIPSGSTTDPPRVFLVTSTSPGEGKSTTTALTAEALAEVNQPTLVIGGDFRRPEVDSLLGVARQPSLYDMARLDVARATVDEVVHRRGETSLYVAPAGKGTREVSGLIEAAKEVAAEGRRRGATVLIDSSPLQAANDPVDLLPAVDYVLLVVRAGRTTESGLVDAIDTLRRMDAKILGIVLIGTPSSGKRQSYYYDYYAPSTETESDSGAADEPSVDNPTTASGAGPEPDDHDAPGQGARVPAGMAGRGVVPDPAVEDTPPPGATEPPRWSPSAEQREQPGTRSRAPAHGVTPPPFQPPTTPG